MVHKFQAIGTIIASVKYTFYHSVRCCALPGDSRVFDQSEVSRSFGIASVIVIVMLRISDYRCDCEVTKRKDLWTYNFAIFYLQHSDQFLRFKWERSCKTRISIVPNKCQIFHIPRARNPRTIWEEHNRVKEFFHNKMQTDAKSPLCLSA